MAQIQVYLGFTDNCQEAMRFYQRCLGGELQVQTVAESPMATDFPAELQGRVLHSILSHGDLTLMASEMVHNATRSQAVSLMLQCTSPQEIETCFEHLSQGGQVTQPLVESFWGSTFGHLTDRYGVNWMLNYTKESAPASASAP